MYMLAVFYLIITWMKVTDDLKKIMCVKSEVTNIHYIEYQLCKYTSLSDVYIYYQNILNSILPTRHNITFFKQGKVCIVYGFQVG